ncbi:MAG: chorismate mutase [Lentisphaeria bacterium]|nr:chorismate mutase [Lentisphaeria bacterium]
MKRPEQCGCIKDIRDEIDRIDQEIVRCLGERARYVHEIVKYKTDRDSVVAKDRQVVMMGKRAEWAREHGLAPELIQTIYRTLIEHNIRKELEALAVQQAKH